MKKIYILVSTLFMIGASAQVGINTQTPAGTLDVNGNLFVRTTLASPVATAYDVLVVNPTTKEVQKVSTNLTSAVNPTIAKVEGRNGLGLVNLGLFDNWRILNFAPAGVLIGTNFSASDDSYTVPSDGIYEIDYAFRYGTGIQASLLGNTDVGILKQTGSAYTVLDFRSFSGINLLVANLTISNTSINSIYRLVAGDKLYFALDSGGISLGLIGSSFASVVVKKISD